MFRSITICIMVFAFGFFLKGCGKSSRYDYDKGYDAAWDGEEAPSSYWASKEENYGYEQGIEDSWMYDVGYDDGYKGKRPRYFNNPYYMDGYKDGKKDER